MNNTPPAAANTAPRWYLAYILLAAFNVVTIGASLWLSQTLTRMFNQSVSANTEFAHLFGELAKLRSIAGEVNAPGNDVFDSRNVAQESARMQAGLRSFETQSKAIRAQISTSVAEADQQTLVKGLDRTESMLANMTAEAKSIYGFFTQGLADKAGERMAAMDRAYADVNKAFSDVEDQLRQLQAARFERDRAQAAALTKYKFALALAIVLMCLSAVVYGYRTYRRMQSDTGEKDKLVSSLNTMNQKMAQIVEQVSYGVADAARQLVAGNAKLAERTETQASTVEQTAASVEELSSTVKQNADHAESARQLAQSVSGLAQRGEEVVASVVATMREINAGARKIADIIGVIDGIAFQTNILALNAAVEAARAGEQGRGFAVVASEVRGLAQRAATAAKEIKALIETSNAKVENGSELVNRAGASMGETVQSIRKLSELMADIATASREQSEGIVQITQAIAQIDAVTQQNAQLVDQVSNATTSLDQQVARIVALLGHGEREMSRTEPPQPSATLVNPAPQALAQPAKVLTTRPALVPGGAQGKNDGEWEEF